MNKTKAQLMEEEIRYEMGRCVHFTGIQNALCKAGVNIRELVGGPDFGWGGRIPCLLMDANRCEVTCSSRRLPTREEAEANVNKDHAHLERFGKVLRAAKDHAKAQGLGRGSGGIGELPCPAECGGTLRYSVASVNGHMHAACSTKGCASWME